MKTTTCGSGTFITFRLGGERKTGQRSGGLPFGRGEAKKPPLCIFSVKPQRNSFNLPISIALCSNVLVFRQKYNYHVLANLTYGYLLLCT
jgi:hypothetical protein